MTLELGGKNPIVVFADADVEAAIDGRAARDELHLAGAVLRLDLAAARAPLAARASSSRGSAGGWTRCAPGSPADESTDTGAIVHRRQFEKVLALPRARARGGLRGSSPAAARPTIRRSPAGMFVRPTLFDNVRPDSRLAQEEIFGPVLAAMPFDTYDEALAIANGVSLGLTASIYTRDLATAHRFARDVAGRLRLGQRHASATFPGTDYGGFKDSGRRPRGGRSTSSSPTRRSRTSTSTSVLVMPSACTIWHASS